MISKYPDIVLMDIRMPEINRYETTPRIRASSSCYKIPVLAMTSYAMACDREQASAAGFTGYIGKPIDPDTVVDEIRCSIR